MKGVTSRSDTSLTSRLQLVIVITVCINQELKQQLLDGGLHHGSSFMFLVEQRQRNNSLDMLVLVTR